MIKRVHFIVLTPIRPLTDEEFWTDYFINPDLTVLQTLMEVYQLVYIIFSFHRFMNNLDSHPYTHR